MYSEISNHTNTLGIKLEYISFVISFVNFIKSNDTREARQQVYDENWRQWEHMRKVKKKKKKRACILKYFKKKIPILLINCIVVQNYCYVYKIEWLIHIY